MNALQAVDQYVVIGHPIAHSKSPLIHAAFARQTGQSLHYQALLAPLDGFAQCVEVFRQRGGKGANVTLPFKLQAYELAQHLTPRATLAGAVNTLSFRDGEIFGDNTDGIGLVRDITENLGFSLRDKRVLLLGAGGAARGALLPLMQEAPASLDIANRTLLKAQELVQQARQLAPLALHAVAYEDLHDSYDCIINATSSSLADDLPPLNPALFATATLAYDMLYAAQPTRFLQFAATHGAQVRDGLGMLVEQAAEAFFVWRGVRPQTQDIYSELRTQLT
jgi:shikimate dehydrogenase